MPQYQLVVRREYFKNQQTTYVLDLDGDTIEEARVHAKQLLYGHSDKWEGKLEPPYPGSQLAPDLKMDPDPEGTLDPHYGFLMGPGRSRIPIKSATLVKVSGEGLDIEAMQTELDEFHDAEKKRQFESPEYQQYLELKAKYA